MDVPPSAAPKSAMWKGRPAASMSMSSRAPRASSVALSITVLAPTVCRE